MNEEQTALATVSAALYLRLERVPYDTLLPLVLAAQLGSDPRHLEGYDLVKDTIFTDDAAGTRASPTVRQCLGRIIQERASREPR